jgi:hypothetical protein
MNKKQIKDKTELGFKKLKRLKERIEKRKCFSGSVTFHINDEAIVKKIDYRELS